MQLYLYFTSPQLYRHQLIECCQATEEIFQTRHKAPLKECYLEERLLWEHIKVQSIISVLVVEVEQTQLHLYPVPQIVGYQILVLRILPLQGQAETLLHLLVQPNNYYLLRQLECIIYNDLF
jgi:hypothetical protein